MDSQNVEKPSDQPQHPSSASEQQQQQQSQQQPQSSDIVPATHTDEQPKTEYKVLNGFVLFLSPLGSCKCQPTASFC